MVGVNQFAVVVLTPEQSSWDQVELRFLVDGRDVVGEVFQEGPGPDPDEVLGADSRLRSVSPQVVCLAEAICTWGCCGGVEVRVRVEGDQVVWDSWHNPDDELDLGEFRFDLARYTAELDRAHRDRQWEWQGRVVARMVSDALAADPSLLERWDCRLSFTGSYPDSRREVSIVFVSGTQERWTQFRLRTPITREADEVQVERVLDLLRTTDPRRVAEVCGGTG